MYVGSLFFSRNPSFALKNVIMQSDGRLTPSKLSEYSSLKPNLNLFEVDVDQLRAHLESVPLIESVRIQRRMPDTLVVDVVERVAVAQVHWKWRAVPFLVDRHGMVLPATRTGQALPLIDGLKLDKLRPGEQMSDDGVQYVLELLSTADAMGLSPQIQFERFDLRSPDYVNATLENGVTARFPRHSASNKLIRLAATMQLAQERGRPVKTVDLVPDGPNTPTY
jgi:cell division protein FtsQ